MSDPSARVVVVVQHRDRLVRFGVEHLEAALSAQGRRIVVTDEGETEDDLVRDMIEVLTSMGAARWPSWGAEPGDARSHRYEAGRAGGWGSLIARFEIPQADGAGVPTPAQVRAFRSHGEGARKAHNTMLAAVKAVLDQRAAERSYWLAETNLTPSLGWSLAGLHKKWNSRKDEVAPWCGRELRTPDGRRGLRVPAQ